jgi:hypothetical protein
MISPRTLSHLFGIAGICAIAATSGYVAAGGTVVTRTVAVDHAITRVVRVPGPRVTVTARPKVTAAASPVASASPSATAHVNGQWAVTVNCGTQQCTGIPDAGPGGSTCGPDVNGVQTCTGDTYASYEQAIAEGATPAS